MKIIKETIELINVEYRVKEASMEFECYKDNSCLLEGFIKWDGCISITLGENGNAHFCSKMEVDDFIKVMERIWVVAENEMEGFDKDLAYG